MRKIEILKYDPAWPENFEVERKLLYHILGNVVIAIHHIGSTAVPRLAAKPIIDILAEIKDLSVLDTLNFCMEAIGYKVKGEFGITGRRYYQKGGDIRTHQLHAFERGDRNIIRHIAFRDYLRSDNIIAEEYAALKKKVAKSCDNDISKYSDGKDAFVKYHEAMAVELYT